MASHRFSICSVQPNGAVRFPRSGSPIATEIRTKAPRPYAPVSNDIPLTMSTRTNAPIGSNLHSQQNLPSSRPSYISKPSGPAHTCPPAAGASSATHHLQRYRAAHVPDLRATLRALSDPISGLDLVTLIGKQTTPTHTHNATHLRTHLPGGPNASPSRSIILCPNIFLLVCKKTYQLPAQST